MAIRSAGSLADEDVTTAESLTTLMIVNSGATMRPLTSEPHVSTGASTDVQQRIRYLEAIDYDLMTATEVLRMATDLERKSLRKALDAGRTEDPASLILEIRSAGSHDFARLGRTLQGRDPNVSYDEVVRDVLDTLKVSKQGLVAEQERGALFACFEQLKLSRPKLEEALAGLPGVGEEHKKHFIDQACAGGAIALAQLSGFGVYLMASTVVGAVSSVLGLALPFAAYATMSSAISLAIGPVGWAALGVWFAHRLASPSAKKTLPAVLIVAAVRSRLEAERRAELEALRQPA